jgi:hypothetical protein
MILDSPDRFTLISGLSCNMLAHMSKPQHAQALDILKKRNGVLSNVTLFNGRVVPVRNIAWGYDLGDPVAHITTNISPPSAESKLPSDFFFANDIVRIVDPENGAVWFESQRPSET